jgi:hypothetical protein
LPRNRPNIDNVGFGFHFRDVRSSCLRTDARAKAVLIRVMFNSENALLFNATLWVLDTCACHRFQLDAKRMMSGAAMQSRPRIMSVESSVLTSP